MASIEWIELIELNELTEVNWSIAHGSFLVHLIPETLEITNLNFIQKNDLVNIEIDQNTIAIVDTVKKTLARKKSW